MGKKSGSLTKSKKKGGGSGDSSYMHGEYRKLSVDKIVANSWNP